MCLLKKFGILSTLLLLISCTKEIIQHKLVTNSSPQIGGSVIPASNSFEHGATVLLTATPAPEYTFKQWKGSISGTNNPLSLTIESDKQVTGEFEKRLYPLSLTIEGNGTVKEEVILLATQSVYPSGSKVALTAIPSVGAVFLNWSGDLNSTENPIEVSFSKAISIRATFGVLDKMKKSNSIALNSMENHEKNNGWYSNHHTLQPPNIRMVAVGIDYFDLDGDGNVEYLFKDENTGEIKFYSKSNARYTQLDLTNGIQIGDTGVRKFVSADLNKDGYVDLIMAGASDDNEQLRGLFISKGTKDGFSKPITLYQGPNEFTHSVAVGDINKDGIADIIAGGKTYFMLGKGDLTFDKVNMPQEFLTAGPPSLGGYYFNATSQEFIDINQDGYVDLLVGVQNNPSDQPKVEDFRRPFHIYFGKAGFPYFDSNKLVLESIDDHTSLSMDCAVYDLDKDGDLDLFVNTSYGYQAHYVLQYYENQGGNKFTNKTKDVFEGTAYDNPNQMEFDWLKVYDIDKDGKPEILIEGQNWKKGPNGWLDPSFNAFKLNANNKFDRVLIK